MNKRGNFISVAEAAELLKISSRTVRRQIIAGKYQTVYKLPGTTGSYLLDRDEIEALVISE